MNTDCKGVKFNIEPQLEAIITDIENQLHWMRAEDTVNKTFMRNFIAALERKSEYTRMPRDID